MNEAFPYDKSIVTIETDPVVREGTMTSCSFVVARPSYYVKSGEKVWKKNPDYIPVKALGEVAEIAKELRIGDKIQIDGQVQGRMYDSKWGRKVDFKFLMTGYEIKERGAPDLRTDDVITLPDEPPKQEIDLSEIPF